MKLVAGKFIDDKGNEVPPEFGNKEQIKLIRQAEQRIELLEGDGLDCDFEETLKINFSFVCICGFRRIIFEDEFEGTVNYDPSDVIGWDRSCSKCGRRYEIEKDNYGDPVVKLQKK